MHPARQLVLEILNESHNPLKAAQIVTNRKAKEMVDKNGSQAIYNHIYQAKGAGEIVVDDIGGYIITARGKDALAGRDTPDHRPAPVPSKSVEPVNKTTMESRVQMITAKKPKQHIIDTIAELRLQLVALQERARKIEAAIQSLQELEAGT